MKILCADDDEGLAKLLQRSLVKQHYQVELATDGQAAWDLAETETYDLILLDWRLPKVAGLEFCQRLRTEQAIQNPNRNTPVLLMTGLNATNDKVMGLDAGADDYVVKPFDLNELLARVRALLRRHQVARSPLLQWGELRLNPNSCEVTYQEQPISLATKEYELLELFLRHPEQIFSLDRLLVALWAVEEMPNVGAVRAHIKGLRQKLKHAGVEDPLKTIYKLGYRLRPSPAYEAKSESGNSVVSSPVTLVNSEWRDVWQECCQSYRDRLSVIQQAASALQHGTLTLEEQQEAEREAHTLIGSLGSFGLDEASHLSRQIQHLLKQQAPLESESLEQLMQLITTLRVYLEDPKEETSESSAAPLTLSSQPAPETTLLIVGDDLPLTELLAREAAAWGLQAKIATDLETAQQLLDSGSIHTILLDLDRSKAINGLTFLTTTHRQYPEIPIVIMTTEATFEQRVEATRLGSQCFLQKPIAPAQVLSTITQVLQQKRHSGAHILIVDDDPALLQLLKTLLEPGGYHVTILSNPQHFWQTLEQTAPDLLILDVELCQPPSSEPGARKAGIPPLSGIELCQVIRSDLGWNRLPVLFLSAHTDNETVQRSFTAGADDFLSKPVVAQVLLTRVKTRLDQRKLWGSNDLDALTGVPLRRKAQQDLTQLMRLAQRQKTPFSLAILDLDYFKHVNDQHGHAAGDQVLSYLGSLLRQSFRQEDVVGRWGGEEFIVGMYGTAIQDGMRRLQAVLYQLAQYVFLAATGAPFQVTCSAGMSQLS
ncbi:MAG: response regulator [Stenomitos frigidus ULC029]